MHVGVQSFLDWQRNDVPKSKTNMRSQIGELVNIQQYTDIVSFNVGLRNAVWNFKGTHWCEVYWRVEINELANLGIRISHLFLMEWLYCHDIVMEDIPAMQGSQLLSHKSRAFETLGILAIRRLTWYRNAHYDIR